MSKITHPTNSVDSTLSPCWPEALHGLLSTVLLSSWGCCSDKGNLEPGRGGLIRCIPSPIHIKHPHGMVPMMCKCPTKPWLLRGCFILGGCDYRNCCWVYYGPGSRVDWDVSSILMNGNGGVSATYSVQATFIFIRLSLFWFVPNLTWAILLDILR